MRPFRNPFTAFLLCSTLGMSSASAEIRLVGMTSIQGVGKVMFEETDSHKQTGWVGVGGEVFGGKIKAVDVSDSRVVIVYGSAEKTYFLADSKTLEGSQTTAKDELFTLSNEELIRRGYNRVQRGDTGMKIAKRNGITISDLQAWNPGINWARLTTETIVRVRKEGP